MFRYCRTRAGMTVQLIKLADKKTPKKRENGETTFLPIYSPLILFSAGYVESGLMLPLHVLVNS